MKVFGEAYLSALGTRAQGAPRLRQHDNIHQSYDEPCQRLFNAIEPGSYIRPHRHWSDHREELLVAVRGALALVTFDDAGAITQVIRLGAGVHADGASVAVELAPETWHTAIALAPGSVLLEIKAGPFDPDQAKDLAAWAPDEGDSEAVRAYQDILIAEIESRTST